MLDGDLRVIDAAPTGNDAQRELTELRDDLIGVLRDAGASPAALIEIERRINLDQITSMVVEEAAADADGKADDREIDPDWFVQWRNRAQDVSSEEMQRLWARLLKGEAKSSGSFSIHAMEFLSRMSRGDAELIGKLGCFAIDATHVYGGSSPAMEAAGLSLTRLIYLSDLGIMAGNFGLGGLTWSSTYRDDPRHGRIALVRLQSKGLAFKAKRPDEKAIDIPGSPISAVGRELLSLAQCEPDLAYLKDVADGMRDRCESISICDILNGEAPGQLRAKILGSI